MINYPFLNKHSTIGVTAPSSGVQNEIHELLQQACKRLEDKGFQVICGETPFMQYKAKSAPAKIRAAEFNSLFHNPEVELIIPPFGGELLIEILEYIDIENIHPTWILGYSDISTLLLAVTLKTGIATAHGTNLIDLRGEYSDATTDKWQSVLSLKQNESIIQYSSEKYQAKWNHENPSASIFHLDSQTNWKIVKEDDVHIKGRLLGGCIDTIRHLIGTPFGEVQLFQKNKILEQPIIWYLENCELSTVDLRRSLVQMKLAGWFNNISGILFGRSPANKPVNGYTIDDLYEELFEELAVPIVYDIDCGHMPPQLTLINGAYAEVVVSKGKGTVRQTFI